jgi:hypothetical protein
MMSESRDEEAANYAGLANINLLLILAGFATMIEICQVNFPFTLIYVSSMRQDLFVSRF